MARKKVAASKPARKQKKAKGSVKAAKSTAGRARKAVKKAKGAVKAAKSTAGRARKAVANVAAHPRRTVRQAADNVQRTASRARDMGESVVTAGELLKETAAFVDSMAARAKGRTRTGSGTRKSAKSK